MNFTIRNIDDYDIDTNSKRFQEVYNLIENFDNYIYEEAYLFEGAVNNNNLGDTLKDAWKNNYDSTVSTTKTAFTAANKVARSLGKLYKHLYNLAFNCIHFIASTISFILDSITSIPRTINNCLDKLKSVSDSVIANLSGDIMLYITHKDIEELYKSNFMNYLTRFKQTAELLQKDEIWQITKKVFWEDTKVLNYQALLGHKQAYKDRIVSSKKIKGNPEELKNKGIIPTLEDLNEKMKRITFTKTKINMKLEGNKSIYLKKPENKSKDLIKISYQGKVTTYAYYLDAMNQLNTDLSTVKDELKKLNNDIGAKISQQAYQHFAELPEDVQKKINKVLVYITNICKTTSQLTVYIQKDIKTVENMIDKIIQSSENNNESDGGNNNENIQ